MGKKDLNTILKKAQGLQKNVKLKTNTIDFKNVKNIKEPVALRNGLGNHSVLGLT